MRRRVVDHRWRADVGGSRRWHAGRLHADEIGKRRVRLDHRFGVDFGKPGRHLAARLDASAADQLPALTSANFWVLGGFAKFFGAADEVLPHGFQPVRRIDLFVFDCGLLVVRPRGVA